MIKVLVIKSILEVCLLPVSNKTMCNPTDVRKTGRAMYIPLSQWTCINDSVVQIFVLLKYGRSGLFPWLNFHLSMKWLIILTVVLVFRPQIWNVCICKYYPSCSAPPSAVHNSQYAKRNLNITKVHMFVLLKII